MRDKVETRKSGFSLVELLACIAIIGVLTSLAMPALSRVGNRGAEVSARRNAQQAAALSASANAIGVYHVIPGNGEEIEDALKYLSTGIQNDDDSRGLLVQLNLTESEIESASKYLEMHDYSTHGQLIYLGYSQQN